MQDKTTLTLCSETEAASLHATEVCEIHDEEEQAVRATVMEGVLCEQFKLVPQIDKTDEPGRGCHTCRKPLLKHARNKKI